MGVLRSFAGEILREGARQNLEKGGGLHAQDLEEDQRLDEIQTPLAEFVFADEGGRLAQTPRQRRLREASLGPRPHQSRQKGPIGLAPHASRQDPTFPLDRIPYPQVRITPKTGVIPHPAQEAAMPKSPLAAGLEQAFAEIASWKPAAAPASEAERSGLDENHTDFLLLYDRAPPERREALLAAFFPEPLEGVAFRHLAQDPLQRGMTEFAHNGALPYEEFRLLRQEGWLRIPGSFRPSGRAGRGRRFPHVAKTRKAFPNEIQLPEISLIGIDWLLGPFVSAYLCRNLGGGVVARREIVEIALGIGDEAFLALLVDPESGAPLFPELAERRLQGADLETAEIRERRRAALQTCDFMFWGDGRGAEILDLTRPEAPVAPRSLPIDRPILALLRGEEV